MRDFSWRYFCATGEIDAYLLYKACETVGSHNEVSATSSEEDPADEE
ncbi:YqzL family protein [Effusibacillus pohliae]